MDANEDSLIEYEDLKKVSKDGLSIIFAKKLTKEVKLAAVKQDGLAILYIKDSDDEIKLAAVNCHQH